MSSRLLRPLWQRMALMVGRAVLRLVDDGPGIQSVQVELLADEVRAEVERFQEYGFTSVPFPGAEVAAVAVGGSRDHLIVVAVDDRRYRMKGLQAGEVAIYTDEGDFVHLKRGGVIAVHAGTRLEIDAPLTTLTGNLHVDGSVTVDGSITADGDVVGAGTSLHTHVHGGVSTGGGNTGGPA